MPVFLLLAASLNLAGQAASPGYRENSAQPSSSGANTSRTRTVTHAKPAVPNNGQPLTAHEKFNVALDYTLSPLEFGAAFAKAGITEVVSPSRRYGRSAGAFAEQFGAAYADEATGNMFRQFIYPTLFHQDPRYFRKGHGSMSSRLEYAFSRVFITPSDSGKTEFNWSVVLGSTSSRVISNFYYPPAARSAGITATDIGLSLLYQGIANSFQEFMPALNRRLSHRIRIGP
ncbi:MAG TPA: hypothetical protein VKV79_02065 [Terriglobia bacterium]|nr:hypothetical protein [Terriglobia bacterium]